MNRPRSIHVKATVISTAVSPGPSAMNTTTARLLANIFAEAYDEAGSPPPLLKERQPSRSELDLETSSFTLNNGQGMPAASSETARAGCPLGYPKKDNPPVNPPVAQPGQFAILPQSSRGVPLGPTATTRTPAKRHLSDRGRSLSLPNPVQYRPDSRPLNDYERYVYRLARIPGRCLHASAHHGAPPPHRYVYRVGGAEAFAAEVASTARQWQLIGRLSPNSLPTYPKTRQAPELQSRREELRPNWATPHAGGLASGKADLHVEPMIAAANF